MSGGERPVSPAARAISILLALLPPLRMGWIVFTVGENVLSNDYVWRVTLVSALLEGRAAAAAGHLFRGTWIGGGHSWLALLPFYWFDARFFAWNLNVELGIGLLLAACRTFLVWRAASAFAAPAARWALLPVLSALGFSVAQVSTFTFGESTLQMHLAQIFVAAGALAASGLAARPGTRSALAALGAVLASWSWGGGLMAWPVLAAAVWASGVRGRSWAIWPVAAAAGTAQYVWFLVLHPLGPAGPTPGIGGLWRVPELLGRPFANGTGGQLGPLVPSALFGTAGLVLAAAAVVSARRDLRARTAALALLAWSVLVAMQIAVRRTDAAPWYTAPMTAFWLALAVLLAGAPRRLAAAGFATIAAGLVFSNRTWEDKSFYLASRSPASAACLRAWREAPPGCHERLFQWGPGYPGELETLARTLERHGLSVFGSRRTYLLQGDTATGRVAFEARTAPPYFSADGEARDPGDFRRLDLVLPPGAAAIWRVDLPSDAVHATFETRVLGGTPGAAADVSASVDGRDAARARIAGPVGGALDLAGFAGKRVTLRLEGGATPVALASPRILLRLGPE